MQRCKSSGAAAVGAMVALQEDTADAWPASALLDAGSMYGTRKKRGLVSRVYFEPKVFLKRYDLLRVYSYVLHY